MTLRRLLGFTLAGSRLLQYARNSLRHPGLNFGADVLIRGANFRHDTGCVVAAGTRISAMGSGRVSLAEGSYVGQYAEIGGDGSIDIGRYASIQDRCILLGDVSIGAYSLLAPGVYISSGRHYFDNDASLLIRDQDERVRKDALLAARHSRPVRIGEDVWIGINSTILAGITIGRGAVIGANTVVTRDVAPYTVVAGVPARFLRHRLNFRPPDRIGSDDHAHLPYFYSGFALLERERAPAHPQQGLSAGGEFSVWLAPSGTAAPTRLCLSAIASSGGTKIAYNGQWQDLRSGDWQQICFPLDLANCGGPQILRSTGSAPFPLRIQSAWLD